jgi:hypothetical protein
MTYIIAIAGFVCGSLSWHFIRFHYYKIGWIEGFMFANRNAVTKDYAKSVYAGQSEDWGK